MIEAAYDHLHRITATDEQRERYSRLVSLGFDDDQATALARAGYDVAFVDVRGLVA